MSNLINELSEPLFKRYNEVSMEENDSLTILEYGEIESVILTLISDYNTFKLLLCEREYDLESKKIFYNDNVQQYQHKYMLEKGMKATQAKDKAKMTMKEVYNEIINIEKDINLLKASIHSTEYQLRLKFQQLKIYGNIDEVIEDE